MQKITWSMICFFLLNNYFIFAIVDKQPLLVVTIMVKNEEPVIEATLKPFLEAGVQHYLILDTGSTDKTVATVRALFKKYKIVHGHIVEQPFVDFAVSRNYALERAEQIFPDAIFFLMIDAEWYMHNVEGLLDFCRKNQNDDSIAYLIKRSFPFHNKSLSLRSAIDYGMFLFKAHKGVRYYGAVHECINQTTHIKVPDDIFIVCDASRAGKAKTACRFLKDINILLKEHKKNPYNLRTIFYLGQTYACLGDYEQALFWYNKRCNKQRGEGENYQAHYRQALIYRLLNNRSQALFFFFKAYSINPQRIEPLINIAQYYLDNHEYQAVFLLAKYITTIPMSSQEISLIMPEMYDSTRYNILAAVAWHVGEYEIGQQATLKALQHDPTDTVLRNNLILYEEALQHRHCNKLDRRSWCNWCNGNFWMTRPAWFNLGCLSHGLYPSNQCNLSHGIAWRSWVGPSFITSSNDF